MYEDFNTMYNPAKKPQPCQTIECCKMNDIQCEEASKDTLELRVRSYRCFAGCSRL
jgi:hypothetical protein